MNKLLDSAKYLFFFLIISILISNIAIYLTHTMNMRIFFNSDALYLPALYKDIVINHGSYSDWYLTPAPYFFPDMLLYFLSNFLTGNYYYAILLFFTLTQLMLLFITYKIYSLFFDKNISLALAAIMFSFLYLFPTVVSDYQLLSAYHYGEFLIGIYTLYLLLKIIEKPEGNFLNILLFIFLSSLTIASDSLFLLHFILPFFFTILSLWLIDRLHILKFIQILIAIVLSVFFGKVLHKVLIIHEKAYESKLLIAQLTNNVETLKNIFLNYYHSHTINFVVWILFLLIPIVILLFKNKFPFLSQRFIPNTKLLFLSFFLFFMLIGTIGALSLITLPLTSRYMIPIFLLPILLSPIYINYIFHLRNQKIVMLSLSFIAIILIFFTLNHSRNKLLHSTVYDKYTTPFIQCFDDFINKTASKRGIGQYWQSKQTYMLSNHEITIGQMNSNIDRFLWITTDKWYKDKYDFALIDNGANKNFILNKEKIISINGEPTHIYNCNKTEILYYKNGMFATYFQTKNSSKRWNASQLPSNIGDKIKNYIIAKKGMKAGYISFGPYISLPSGRYKFDINYMSSESNTTNVGTWDVVVALPKKTEKLKNGILIGTNGKNAHIVNTFTILERYNEKKVEIRNFYNGIGDLTIKSLTITRVQ